MGFLHWVYKGYYKGYYQGLAVPETGLKEGKKKELIFSGIMLY